MRLQAGQLQRQGQRGEREHAKVEHVADRVLLDGDVGVRYDGPDGLLGQRRRVDDAEPCVRQVDEDHPRERHPVRRAERLAHVRADVGADERVERLRRAEERDDLGLDDRAIRLDRDACGLEREGRELLHRVRVQLHLEAESGAHREGGHEANQHPEQRRAQEAVPPVEDQKQIRPFDRGRGHDGDQVERIRREQEGSEPLGHEHQPACAVRVRRLRQLKIAPEPRRVVIRPAHCERARVAHGVRELLDASLLEREVRLMDAKTIEEAGLPPADQHEQPMPKEKREYVHELGEYHHRAECDAPRLLQARSQARHEGGQRDRRERDVAQRHRPNVVVRPQQCQNLARTAR
mmetsp:Transcript_18993/g.48973  ORF Transcript_18993/g.48973 Transcript_18993/m.48973 type:complete len:349 (-) Transcript_18993:226-1272(-)